MVSRIEKFHKAKYFSKPLLFLTEIPRKKEIFANKLCTVNRDDQLDEKCQSFR